MRTIGKQPIRAETMRKISAAVIAVLALVAGAGTAYAHHPNGVSNTGGYNNPPPPVLFASERDRARVYHRPRCYWHYGYRRCKDRE
jgi:hypothetical protein